MPGRTRSGYRGINNVQITIRNYAQYVAHSIITKGLIRLIDAVYFFNEINARHSCYELFYENTRLKLDGDSTDMLMQKLRNIPCHYTLRVQSDLPWEPNWSSS